MEMTVHSYLHVYERYYVDNSLSVKDKLESSYNGIAFIGPMQRQDLPDELVLPLNLASINNCYMFTK